MEPEIPEPQPKRFYEHILLVIGVFLMALVPIHHLLLQSLGWCLRNQRLLLWVCGVYFEICRALLAMFGWVPLVGWVAFLGLVIQFLLGVDLGITR